MGFIGVFPPPPPAAFVRPRPTAVAPTILAAVFLTPGDNIANPTAPAILPAGPAFVSNLSPFLATGAAFFGRILVIFSIFRIKNRNLI